VSYVSASVKCYQCDSSNPLCLDKFFIPAGITIVDSCTCCRKLVNSDGTKRECGGILDAYKCVPLADTNFVCVGDLCNGASGLRHQGIAVVAGAAILVLAAVFGAVYAR
jgi:hypothetical protein